MAVTMLLATVVSTAAAGPAFSSLFGDLHTHPAWVRGRSRPDDGARSSSTIARDFAQVSALSRLLFAAISYAGPKRPASDDAAGMWHVVLSSATGFQPPGWLFAPFPST